MKILIADDDEDQLRVRSMLLAQSGFETIPVSDAAAALKAAAAKKPECAVVDLRMPTEELGLGLIRSLKKLDADIRIFVLTGCDPKKFRGLPEDKLVEEIIVKGSPVADLIKKLRKQERVLGEASQRKQPRVRK